MTTPTQDPDPPGLVHAALLYHSPEERAAALDAFLDDAIAAGEPVLAVLPGDHRASIETSLRVAGDRVTVEDMERVGANPARLLGAVEEWLAERDGPARIMSEPVWPGRRRAEAIECLRHEAALNLALADRAVSVLCPYDAVALDAEVLAGAELTHPQIIDRAGPRPSLTYADQHAALGGDPWPQDGPGAAVRVLDFDGDLASLRHAVVAESAYADLTDRRREDLALAVNEAASNALRHGDGRCEVGCWVQDDCFVVEIATASAIADRFAGRRRPAAGAPGGRGLWLINQVCDLVELRTDETGSRLRLHLGAA